MTPAALAISAVFTAAIAATVATHLAIYRQTDEFQEWFPLLLAIDGLLILLLLATAAIMAGRLFLQWRRGVRGARLSLRLTALLSTMSILPALLLYGVSVGAVFRGIESWFDLPLGESFERGIAFGQDVIGREFDRLEYVARDIARGAAQQRGGLTFYLDDARLLYSLQKVAAYNGAGQLVAASGDPASRLAPPALIRRDLDKTPYIHLQGDGLDRLLAVGVPIPLGRGTGGALLVTRALPGPIAEGLAQIDLGRKRYEKLKFLRAGLRQSFILTMTLSLSIILLAIGWLSLRLGSKLTRPLVQLSAAAEAVGGGDFRPRLRPDEPIEEMAQINRAFNTMVGELHTSQRQAAERQAALTAANAYLENLLSSLTTGVLTFHADGLFSGGNAAAARFFPHPPTAGAPLPPGKLAQAINAAVTAALAPPAVSSPDTREDRILLPDGSELLLRILPLSAAAGGGALAMIDDISRQMRAEREATWEEASRRFVHEIKNPLTPIQLAAERLHHKLADKLSAPDRAMLARLSDMIVNQVGAMRQMVDSFRDYADKRSAPPASPLRLNDLLTQVLYFYETADATLHLHLCADNPQIMGNAVTLRQMLHNIIGNAAAAVSGKSDATIDIATAIAADMVELRVQDNGGGAPAAILGKLCEPYVTTKRDGTGLGLAVVRKTVDEHGGTLHLKNHDAGLRVTVRLPMREFPPLAVK